MAKGPSIFVTAAHVSIQARLLPPLEIVLGSYPDFVGSQLNSECFSVGYNTRTDIKSEKCSNNDNQSTVKT